MSKMYEVWDTRGIMMKNICCERCADLKSRMYEVWDVWDTKGERYEKYGRLSYFPYLRGEIPLQEVWWSNKWDV